jgi:hypothetical protein
VLDGRARIAAVAVAASIAATAAPAAADPGPIRRVVLVNPTPDLAHAARTALAPWTIEVVEETRTDPVDATLAATIAADRVADRVAWLDGGELIVVDPATGENERRPAPAGASDAPAAASVALSLKTLLRLPPVPEVALITPVPPPDEPVVDDGVAAPPRRRMRLVPEAGGAVRFPIGGTLAAQPRVTFGFGVNHPRWRRWRASVVGAVGPEVEAGKGSLQGTWFDVEAGAQLAYEHSVHPRLAVVPRLRIAGHRTHVFGRLPPQDTLDAIAYGVEIAAEAAIWLRAGRFHAGVGGGMSGWVGFPDYIRRNVMVFESAPATAQVYGTVLVDL